MERIATIKTKASSATTLVYKNLEDYELHKSLPPIEGAKLFLNLLEKKDIFQMYEGNKVAVLGSKGTLLQVKAVGGHWSHIGWVDEKLVSWE